MSPQHINFRWFAQVFQKRLLCHMPLLIQPCTLSGQGTGTAGPRFVPPAIVSQQDPTGWSSSHLLGIEPWFPSVHMEHVKNWIIQPLQCTSIFQNLSILFSTYEETSTVKPSVMYSGIHCLIFPQWCVWLNKCIWWYFFVLSKLQNKFLLSPLLWFTA